MRLNIFAIYFWTNVYFWVMSGLNEKEISLFKNINKNSQFSQEKINFLKKHIKTFNMKNNEKFWRG